MTDDITPDYQELLRSPYDPDPPGPRREGESDLPWIPAVVAAVAGALLVSAFVIYSLVTRPEPSEEAIGDDVSTTTTTNPPVPSVDLPPGFAPLTDDVGVRVEAIESGSQTVRVAVATAVTGGSDPADIPQLDVAYWELEANGATERMTGQYEERGALGNITVEFPEMGALGRTELVAYLAVGREETSSSVELPITSVPGSLSDYRIDLGNGNTLIVDLLTIGDGWGWINWHTEGRLPARVETVVTYVGTDDPATDDVDATRLTSPHIRVIGQGTGSRPLPPLYGFVGSEALVRSGEPLSGVNAFTSIVVDLAVSFPEGIGAPMVIEIASEG